MDYREYLKYQDVDNILDSLYKELEMNKNDILKYNKLKAKISDIVAYKRRQQLINKLEQAKIKERKKIIWNVL